MDCQTEETIPMHRTHGRHRKPKRYPLWERTFGALVGAAFLLALVGAFAPAPN